MPKLAVVGERSPGTSMTLVTDQVAERLEVLGFDVEIVDVASPKLLERVHQQPVVTMNQGLFMKWLKSERFCHPTQIISVFAADWQEYPFGWQVFYLSHLFKPKHAGVPVIHVSHSVETDRAMMETAKTFLKPGVVADVQKNMRRILYGVEDGFVPGANERTRHVVPYNRINTSEKNCPLHAQLTREFYQAIADQAEQPVTHYYLSPDRTHGTESYEDVYKFQTQPDRHGYKMNAAMTGMFLSTSRYESFGIYFMELLLSGAVGVFQDYPWVRSLLPDYPFVAPASEIVPMMRWVFLNHAEAKAMIAPMVEKYRALYRLDRFVSELADLIKVEMPAALPD